MKDDFIRDRIVVGVKDAKLSDELQGKPDLMLEMAVRTRRKWEARKESQKDLQGDLDQPMASVNFFKKAKKAKGPKQNPKQLVLYQRFAYFNGGHDTLWR